MGSLLDGIEVSPAAHKATKVGAASTDAGKAIKLTIAIAGLVVGGGLIAWNAGLFGKAQVGAQEVDPTVPPEVAAAHTPITTQSTAPQISQPNRPKTNTNFH